MKILLAVQQRRLSESHYHNPVVRMSVDIEKEDFREHGPLEIARYFTDSLLATTGQIEETITKEQFELNFNCWVVWRDI